MVSENKTWKLRTHLMSYPPCDMKVCPAKSSITFNAHTCPTKSLIFTKITVLISQNMEKMSLTETINLITSHCMDPSKKKKEGISRAQQWNLDYLNPWFFKTPIFFQLRAVSLGFPSVRFSAPIFGNPDFSTKFSFPKRFEKSVFHCLFIKVFDLNFLVKSAELVTSEGVKQSTFAPHL